MKFTLDPKIQKRLGVNKDSLLEFCHRNHVQKLGLFGSILREDFNEKTSDVDVLIEFEGNFKIGLIAFIGIEQDLEDLLHRKVDLASWKGIEESVNPLRKKIILETARVIYDAAR